MYTSLENPSNSKTIQALRKLVLFPVKNDLEIQVFGRIPQFEHFASKQKFSLLFFCFSYTHQLFIME